jgi:tetraacyldisaccharide 4'-kinase
MRQSFSEWVEQGWYSQKPLWPLLPLQPLYVITGLLRRWAYRVGLKKSWRAPVPVLVVGNISVGGTGKTPLTIALIKAAQAKQLKVGVVSRGYGRLTQGTLQIQPQHSATDVGDEPLLIHQRTGAEVAVASKRKDAVQCLLNNTEVDFIIADDGLQHYALARNAEVVVIDNQRGLGNGWQLPCGPLREPASRLSQVDALVVNDRGGQYQSSISAPYSSTMQLQGQTLINLVSGETKPLADFNGQSAIGIAGIGNPKVFYKQLAEQGIDVTASQFSDHHHFTASDLPAVDRCVVMTEKDAVKLRPIAAANGHQQCWYLPVDAKLDEGFAEQLIETSLVKFQNRRTQSL